MKIPTTLKHKPVIVSEDYDKIDGRDIKSDAKGLSIGLAQWNDRGKVDVSGQNMALHRREMVSTVRRNAAAPGHRSGYICLPHQAIF